MLTAYIVLLRDNAPACTRTLLEHFSCELLDLPTYSSNITPSDNLFAYLKMWLRSQLFNINELMEGVKMWLSVQAADFFDTGIQKLFP
jgi:hypothetical protein